MKIRKFLGRVFFIVCGAFLAFIISNMLYYKLGNPKREVAFEVYEAIDKAERNEGYTILILGDSVARQIFDPVYQDESSSICYMATNQAIMTVGNYILLSEFLSNNPQLEEVYYVARPDSIQSDMNFIFTYSYFVTPLYIEPFRIYLSGDTQKKVEELYGKKFSENGFLKWMLSKYPKLLDSYLKMCNNRQKLVMLNKNKEQKSNMAYVYLKNMEELCEKNNIKFHMLASPLPNNIKKYDIEQELSNFSGDIQNEYMESLVTVDESEFRDGVHLTEEYLKKNRLKIKEQVLCQTE